MNEGRARLEDDGRLHVTFRDGKVTLDEFLARSTSASSDDADDNQPPVTISSTTFPALNGPPPAPSGPRRYEGTQADLTAIDISADGQRVVTGALSGTVRLYDGQTGRLLNHRPGAGQSVKAVRFLPGAQRLLLTYGPDRTATVGHRAPRESARFCGTVPGSR